MRQDGGAFDGCAALEVVAGCPGGWGREVGWGVPRAEVEDCYFVGGGGGVRRVVVEGAGWGVGWGVGGVEDGGEGEAEDGDGVRGLQGVLEVALVEDVAFCGLDDEEDAEGEGGGGFRGAVGVVRGGEAGG